MRQDLIIAGQQHAPQLGYFDVYSPFTEEKLGEAARGTAEDLELALISARKGFEHWSGLAPAMREACLLRLADRIAEVGEPQFLELLVEESGSTITKARAEISYSIELLRAAAGEARRLYGDTFPNDDPGKLSMVFREPLGVIAVLAPYNAPLALLVKMLAFPLAAGNSVIVKPSEETPLIAGRLVMLMLACGFPVDSVQLLTGYGHELGKAMVSHPAIDAVALTGSSQTGIAVAKAAVNRMIPMQLELGGKSAIIVMPDVDVEQAAAICGQGIFTHAGQICMANSRILVHQAIYTDFVHAIKAFVDEVGVGDPWQATTLVGPLINRRALNKVIQHVDEALQSGAELVCGGRILEGLVYAPTLLQNVARESRAWREESFGPLASLTSFAHTEEAIALANDSDYGLSAAILTRRVDKAFQMAKKIDAGSVHIGMHAFQSNTLAPIGGSKLSGLGRSGGKYSTEEFTRLKWVSLTLGDSDEASLS